MESMTLLEIVSKGGILIIPIVICSVIVVAVAVERYLSFRRQTINIPQFMMKIRHPLSRGDVVSAINECAMVKSPVSAVVRAGLEQAKYGREHIKEAMEMAGNTETYHLERRLSGLATLATITPLIGFLGTVTGMIKAFMKIQQLAGNVNADVLAGGIWEAMVTTAAGLAVGIPAVILYNYFINRVKGFVYEMETAGDEVLNILSKVSDLKTGDREEKPAERERPQQPEEDDADYRQNRPDEDDRMRLADQSFDPADFESDGGRSS